MVDRIQHYARIIKKLIYLPLSKKNIKGKHECKEESVEISERVRAIDVANYFLSIESMDHKKLQKLCYYAQCWFCGLGNKSKLMDSDFEAWIHGPVSPSLYHTFKEHGWESIPKLGVPITLDIIVTDFLKNLYGVYGKFTGDQLETLTHSESPWKNARGNLSPTEPCTTVISYDDMYMFCKEQLQETDK